MKMKAGSWERVAGSWERVAVCCRLLAAGFRCCRLPAIGLLLIFSFLNCVEAQGYDFAVRMGTGDTLYFEVTDLGARSVKVVAPQMEGPNYYAGHVQPAGVLVVPDQVSYRGKSYVVTAVGERAFSGCSRIRLVELPPTVERIEDFAFYGCSGINERVRIGEKVKHVGGSAFYGCSALTEVSFAAEDCAFMGGSISTTAFGNCPRLRKVVVEEGVKRIPDYAFCGNDVLKDTLGLPQTLEYIGDYAFAFCNALSGSVVIPDRVRRIGECAFHQCHSIRTVTIGSSVATIGGRAFYHCINLKSVKVRAYNPPEIAFTTFSNLAKGVKFSVPCVSKVLYEKDGYWKKLAPFSAVGKCTFSVKAAMENGAAGTVTGSGSYRYGDSVRLAVICGAGYAFTGWSDGNKENPRVLKADNNYELEALTEKIGEARVDTIYSVDTVYRDGYRMVHDTVDMFDVVRSINDIPEVTYDAEGKHLGWSFPKTEKVLAVAVYNSVGECLYLTDSRSGGVRMGRFPAGTYIVRIETVKRVLRLRLFKDEE